MANKIQCIGTSTPASFAKLQAERHWLADYFEPIEVAPAKVEDAIKVLQGVKKVYEDSTTSPIQTMPLTMPSFVPISALSTRIAGTAVDLSKRWARPLTREAFIARRGRRSS